jgi:dihydropyrimidinase
MAIAAVGRDLRGTRTVDATGFLVLPGAIDGHVHMRTDRATDVYDDTFATGSVAAAFGGVTTMLDQAQVEPGQTLADGLDRRLAEAEGQCLIDYGFHVNLREPSRDRVDEIPDLATRGFRRIKMFMYYETYRLPDEVIFAAMRRVAQTGGLSIVHAENAAVIDELLRENALAGRTGAYWNARARPPASEGEATHRALALAAVAGSPVLIFHMTTADGVRELRLARERGQDVFGEVCPQYLLLGEEAWDDPHGATALDFSPPLRDRCQRDALWAALGDATIDVVSTDHGPRRRRPRPDGTVYAPPGTSGIELRLALMYTHGVRAGRLSPNRWVDACCTRPARVFNLPAKGRVEPGCDADLVIFDPERRMTVSAEALHSDVDHSTYEGTELHGFPRVTIARGEVVTEDGELHAEPGRGRLLLDPAR